MFGGMGEAIAVLSEHVESLDTGKLVAYAIRYAKSSVARRLGWTMSRVGVGDVLQVLQYTFDLLGCHIFPEEVCQRESEVGLPGVPCYDGCLLSTGGRCEL